MEEPAQEDREDVLLTNEFGGDSRRFAPTSLVPKDLRSRPASRGVNC